MKYVFRLRHSLIKHDTSNVRSQHVLTLATPFIQCELGKTGNALLPMDGMSYKSCETTLPDLTATF